MPHPYFEMEESRSVTPWVNRLDFEPPRASSFLGLRLVKTRHKNLVPLLSGVKPDPMVGSGRYAEAIPVKSPKEICVICFSSGHCGAQYHKYHILFANERCVSNAHPVNMSECAGTESELKRCCRHRFNSDSVTAQSGIFIGQVALGFTVYRYGRGSVGPGLTKLFHGPTRTTSNNQCSAAENAKFWVAQRTTHDWWLGPF